MPVPTANVPCNGCTLCCKGDLIVMHPEMGDDRTQYLTDKIHSGEPIGDVYALKHKPNGDCIYLGDAGCTIHDRRPGVCREFDCRVFYKSATRATRRRYIAKGIASRGVFERGRELSKMGDAK